MENIVQELIGIETKAKVIEMKTEADKKAFKGRVSSRLKELELEIDAENKEKIRIMQERMTDDMDRQVAEISAESQRRFSALEEETANESENIARKLFESIVGGK